MQITKFRAFMEGYVSFLEEMAAGEQEKYAAILSYDPKRMDKVVSRQQAMNMRLTQLEEQREKEQEEAGIAGLTFQQIQDRLEGADGLGRNYYCGVYQDFFSYALPRLQRALVLLKPM